MKDMKRVNQTIPIIRNGNIWIHVRLKKSFWGFQQGLVVYRDFSSEKGIEGILSYPCRFVYLLGTGFAIDVIYFNQKKEVIRIQDGLVPFKFSPYIGNAQFLLVVPAETAANVNLRVGERLWW